MGYEPRGTSEQISHQYFNLHKRLVNPIKRKVMYSKEFSCPEDLKKGLRLVTDKIERGEDIRLHLSKEIFNLDYNDYLLNDWGIHHIHLGTKLNKYGYIERTGPVLFVRFTDQFAYYINVMGHGSWGKQELVRILSRNWPESISQFRLIGISGRNPKIKDSDVVKLREMHVMTFTEGQEGEIYAPFGMGITSSGMSVDAVRTSDYYLNRIKTIEHYIVQNCSKLINQAKKIGYNFNHNIHMVLGIEGENIYALEVNSRVFFNLGKL
ncbi:hypothetical protein [Fictibacillus phosphorivorans]|uniref:hypothetical protein n=1 Tax=Fictibacillus phosphorivorans TaxID=1221500 RepID=UPI0016426D98|nr:hypothetical protein [Fictibacillus phosphorivorans]